MSTHDTVRSAALAAITKPDLEDAVWLAEALPAFLAQASDSQSRTLGGTIADYATQAVLDDVLEVAAAMFDTASTSRQALILMLEAAWRPAIARQ